MKELITKTVLLTCAIINTMPLALAEVTDKRIKEIPAGISFNGSLYDAREIADAEGKHIVILSSVSSGTFGRPNYKSEIYAYKYSYRNGEYIKDWAIKEKTPSFLVSVNFIGKLEVLDIDGDNLAETVFMYDLTPDGLDPITRKLMLHHRNRKYAIRGEIPQEGDRGYPRKADRAFDQLPGKVKTYALRYWDKAH
jgi:hypothetical protein